ncbi:MAG: hypothetical protein JXX29_10580 [Deltaproteobacteria bacterium]|nr:hypothetical protein [Deltaproteobacteria bacterium]MBN2672113.1 hypothetical protein [Deltaproteobacteria bacterium]
MIVGVISVCSFWAYANDAKQQFEEGLALFQKGEFEEAAKKFRSANELRPNWRILYNLGQSEAAAKQYGLAIASFEKYLSQGGDEIPDARRAYVIKELQQMREMVGFLEIKAPDGIEIYIDGIHRGATPFAMNIPVAASVEHELVAYMEGNQVNTKIVMVMGQQTAVVTVEIENVQLMSSSGIDWGKEDASAAQRAEPPEPKQTAQTMKTLSLVIGALGGAAIVGGTVTGIAALKKRQLVSEQCADGCYSDDYDLLAQRDRLALVTDVLLVSGALLVATGTLLFFVSKKRAQKEASASQTALSTVVLAGGGFTTIEVRF